MATLLGVWTVNSPAAWLSPPPPSPTPCVCVCVCACDPLRPKIGYFRRFKRVDVVKVCVHNGKASVFFLAKLLRALWGWSVSSGIDAKEVVVGRGKIILKIDISHAKIIKINKINLLDRLWDFFSSHVHIRTCSCTVNMESSILSFFLEGIRIFIEWGRRNIDSYSQKLYILPTSLQSTLLCRVQISLQVSEIQIHQSDIYTAFMTFLRAYIWATDAI